MVEQRYISSHIDSQLPDFIRADHPMFKSFIEAYYEFMEQDPNATYGSAKLMDYADIDDTLESFVSNFKDMYLKNFPIELAINPQTGKRVSEDNLIKNIKDFYSTRGSERSFNLLFQLFYNTSAELYMPKEDMLVVSGGTWQKDFIIKITSKNKTKLNNTTGMKLVQVNSSTNQVESHGIISDIIQYSGEGLSLTVTELKLENVYQSENFVSGSKICILLPTGEILTERLLSMVTGISIQDAGLGYDVGDQLNFSGGGLGAGAKGYVSEVDPNGSLLNFQISDYGTNYTNTPDVNITRRGIEVSGGAQITAMTGSYYQDSGRWLNEGGWLSSKKKIQDSWYYQNYSYVIKSDLVLDRFKELVKKTIHPTGMNLFAQVQIRRELQSDLPFSARMTGKVIPVIGHYTPYTFLTYKNLGFNGLPDNTSSPVDGLYAYGYNPRSELPNHCMGDTGGLIVIIQSDGGTGFDGNEFSYAEGVTSSGGRTAEVFNWSVIPNILGGTFGGPREFGGTGMTGYLRLMNFEDGLIFSDNDIIHGSTSGYTGSIDRTRQGNGVVSEYGALVHSNSGATAYSLGGSSSTNDSPWQHTAENMNHMSAYGRDYWVIYNHPNLRVGGGIPDGATLGSIDILTMNYEEGGVREFTLGGSVSISQSLNYPYVALSGSTSGNIGN
ncbi:MAG: hypothetical protein H8D80_02530 [Proteobacteria bacterium]|nr:hypothetical protein [Pseudomonadota bacterium]